MAGVDVGWALPTSEEFGGRRPSFATSRIIQVHNKIDLASAAAAAAGVGDDPAREKAILTSALTGEGIAALAAAIGRSLVPDPPAAGAAIPFTPQHVESLEVARNAIERRHAAAAREALQSLLAK